jgi:hypothetical protein
VQIDLEPKRPLVTALGFTAAIFNFVLAVRAATPPEPPPPTPRVTYLRLDEVRVVKPVEDRIHQCSRPCYAFYSPSGIPIAQGPQSEIPFPPGGTLPVEGRSLMVQSVTGAAQQFRVR